MRTRTYQRTGWPISEIGYGMWGPRRLDGLGRCGNGRVTRGGRPPGLHVLRHGLGLRRGRHASGCWRQAAQEIIRNLACGWPRKVPAEERALDSADGFALDEVFPPDHVRAFTERSLEEPRRGRHRRPAVPRVERRLGRTRIGCRGTLEDSEAGGQGPVAGASASTAGSRPTSCKAAAHGLIDLAQVVSQHLRPGAPRSELFRTRLAARASPIIAPCPSTKAA